jgi:catechol 2,3-dioxygenase-like lactoylglutathione lyase family enzyme
MNFQPISIRTFIGAKDYLQSRDFYRTLGFEEVNLGPKMCYFRVNDRLGFYLQDYYVKDWVDNSMIFLEVDDLDLCYEDLRTKNLKAQFPGVRFSAIKNESWGREFFMHDPSGVLWHFGTFK